MKHRHTSQVLTAIMLTANVALTSAQQPFMGPAIPPMPADSGARTQLRPTGVTTVLGSAWDAANRPLPGARVQLRSVTSGRVAANAVANQGGEFTFTGVDSDTYVTELVDANGNVLALGDAFTIDPGQTIVTFVRLPERQETGTAGSNGRGGFFAGGLWGAAAAAALGAAAGAGVAALKTCDCDQVSPER